MNESRHRNKVVELGNEKTSEQKATTRLLVRAAVCNSNSRSDLCACSSTCHARSSTLPQMLLVFGAFLCNNRALYSLFIAMLIVIYCRMLKYGVNCVLMVIYDGVLE